MTNKEIIKLIFEDKERISELFTEVQQSFSFEELIELDLVDILKKEICSYIRVHISKRYEVSEEILSKISDDDILEEIDIRTIYYGDYRFERLHNAIEYEKLITEISDYLPLEVIEKIIDESSFYLECYEDVRVYEASNEYELGIYLVDNIYCGVSNLSEKTLEYYFDYKGFGQDYSYDLIQTDCYYIEIV